MERFTVIYPKSSVGSHMKTGVIYLSFSLSLSVCVAVISREHRRIGYRFLFRHSLFRQFIFGRKSIHASDVRNCHGFRR